MMRLKERGYRPDSQALGHPGWCVMWTLWNIELLDNGELGLAEQAQVLLTMSPELFPHSLSVCPDHISLHPWQRTFLHIIIIIILSISIAVSPSVSS